MNKLPRFLIGCSIFALMPAVAGAAGTYYTGNYQSPQQRYTSQSYSAQRGGTYTQNGVTYNRVPQGGYNYNNTAASRNGATRTNTNVQGTSASTSNQRSGTTTYGKGFTVGAGLSHETAMWKFEMKDAGSVLRHDDVSWNVFDLHGAYVFDAGSVQLKVDAGFKYGMQFGDGSTVDDDITNGGSVTDVPLTNEAGELTGEYLHLATKALSIGTNSDGNMYGVHAGIGWVDAFKLGGVRFTPSVGYRYFKHKLETKKNYGMAMSSIIDGEKTNYCVEIDGDKQCLPVLITDSANGVQIVPIKVDEAGNIMYDLTAAGSVADVLDTFAFEQSGTSHSYEVEWSGPYIAMDMEYQINQNNMINGRIELGFPGYTATGDQPARVDWAHPKSVEDKASMFSAFHLGMGANWTTALTDMLSLSLGVTYDYYNVSGADMTVYLNPEYWNAQLDELQAEWDATNPSYAGLNYMINGVNENGVVIAADEDAVAIVQAEKDGWKISQKKEIDSFYKSLGIRVGLVARF